MWKLSSFPTLCLVGVAVILCAQAVRAREKALYQTGKLIDVRAYATEEGVLRAQHSFCLAIQVDDISYIVHYEAAMRGNYEPTNLIIGDPIEVKIEGNKMTMKTGKKWVNDITHKEHDEEAKMNILRRERVLASSKPATCALPVAVDH